MRTQGWCRAGPNVLEQQVALLGRAMAHGRRRAAGHAVELLGVLRWLSQPHARSVTVTVQCWLVTLSRGVAIGAVVGHRPRAGRSEGPGAFCIRVVALLEEAGGVNPELSNFTLEPNWSAPHSQCFNFKFLDRTRGAQDGHHSCLRGKGWQRHTPQVGEGGTYTLGSSGIFV